MTQYFQDIPSTSRPLARLQQVTSQSEEVTVLIEWKDTDRTNPFSALVAHRMDALANLLHVNSAKPTSFRVLECISYFEDVRHSRYGLLYRLPLDAAEVPPVTLYDLLARGETAFLPDLGDRFILAQAISQSVLRLHDCGWVHAGLRSSNIMIFKKGTDQLSLLLTSPYIGGFTYSRPTDPIESTLEYSRPSDEHDVYRHPEVLRSNPFLPFSRKHTRFEQRHDLFSLGIILLEIGLWERAIALKKPKYSPEKYLEKLLTAYLPLLGHKMGAVYRDVVQSLLVDSTVEASQHLPQNADADAATAAAATTGNSDLEDPSDRNTSDDEPDIDSIDLRYGDNKYWAMLISKLAMCKA